MPTRHDAKVGASPSPQLRRTITLPQAVALYAGAVVGAGVLLAPGVAASTAGPASLVAWAIDGLLGIPLALTIAALASRYADAGGVAAYTSRAFGAPAGAAVGWLYFCAAAVGQTLVPLTGAHYLAVALGWGHSATVAIAAGILAVSVAVNLAGLKIGARLQLILAAALVALLMAATIAAVPDFTARSLTPFAPKGWSAVGSACVVLFFAFFGWEAIAHLSAEFRNPERDVPLATLLTVGLVTALYVGIAVAVVATHTYGDPARDRTAVAHLLGNAIGIGAERVAAVAALIVTLATNNAFVAAASRLGYALGRDGAFPRYLGRIDGRGIPTRAIVFVAVVAFGGLVLAEVRHLGAEDFLIVPNASVIVVYVVAMAAGVRLLHGRARLSAVIAALCCAAVLPFVGLALALPAGVAAAALLYWWRFGPGAAADR